MEKIKVLLIDDEVEFTAALAERLEIRGYEVERADNGASGIELIQRRPFDIALLDLMMPGMTGLDALRQIKSFNTALPVILLTGHGSTKEGMEGMNIGAAAYLLKPLDINELLEKMNEVLNEE